MGHQSGEFGGVTNAPDCGEKRTPLQPPPSNGEHVLLLALGMVLLLL